MKVGGEECRASLAASVACIFRGAFCFEIYVLFVLMHCHAFLLRQAVPVI